MPVHFKGEKEKPHDFVILKKFSSRIKLDDMVFIDILKFWIYAGYF